MSTIDDGGPAWSKKGHPREGANMTFQGTNSFGEFVGGGMGNDGRIMLYRGEGTVIELDAESAARLATWIAEQNHFRDVTKKVENG